MEDSILATTKKNLGIASEYTAFDLDIITHINSAFSTLQQLGVGPAEGFFIEGASESWEEYLELDAGLNMVKTYVYLKVRLTFDPPGTSFHLDAMKEQISQLEWRINHHYEWNLDPVDPMVEEEV